MACIADQGFACECSAAKLASAPGVSGRVLLCPQCARAYLGPNAPGDERPIVAITWAQLDTELGNRDSDRYAFEWLRSGVPVDMRRTLVALPLPRAGRFAVTDRAGAVLALTFVVLMALSCARVLQ